MLLSTNVEITLNNSNIKYYESKGYIIPRYKDKWRCWKVKRCTKIIVKIEDLTEGSDVYVNIKCDNCNKEYTKKYSKFILHRKRSNIDLDYCESCKGVAISNKQRKSINNLKAELNNFTNIKWIGQENEYKNTSSKLTFMCNDSHIFSSSLDNLKNKCRVELCPICSFIKYHQGEGHWNWQGGKTSKNMKIRNSKIYKLWRISVFERDDFTCKCCGKRGGKLQAHHILNFSDYPHLIFDIKNGITFCINCHKRFHKLFTQFHNTYEQLKMFLKKG